MIPRLGRVFPYAMTVLGIFDVLYVWSIHKMFSIFIAIITIFLIYFMFKDHSAVQPKRAVHHFVTPLALMLVILASTYLIFF